MTARPRPAKYFPSRPPPAPLVPTPHFSHDSRAFFSFFPPALLTGAAFGTFFFPERSSSVFSLLFLFFGNGLLLHLFFSKKPPFRNFVRPKMECFVDPLLIHAVHLDTLSKRINSWGGIIPQHFRGRLGRQDRGERPAFPLFSFVG